MPTLDWLGKQAVINHHKTVPFHLLKAVPELSVGDPNSGNLLVQGDNLLALKALLPYYAGKVKCIYIDPPYNTGEESWIYDDNVDSPEIRNWLGKTVGSEMEDLSRHDKWLCMMYPRLFLLREMLRDDGTIWISIDDNEIQDARSILDEIFERKNFFATIVWQKRISPESRFPLGAAHDYILVYAKRLEIAKGFINKLPLSIGRERDYKNPDNDPRGPWASRDMTGQIGHAAATQFYEIVTPHKKYLPPSGRCWTVAEETFQKLLKDKRIWFGKSGSSRPRIKIFLSESKGGNSWTWWDNSEVGHNQEATKEIKQIFGEGGIFETPKPTRLIKRILQLATNPNDLVLDSFAGSGTTAHAVLALNKEGGGNRHFILVEMDQEICRTITAQRIHRICKGYDWNDQRGNIRHEEGLEGGFSFCVLGPTLFDENGQIRDEVTFIDLARHVYFIETGAPLPANYAAGSPLLGIFNNTAVYLLYNGILKDTKPEGGNILSRELLATLPPYEGAKIVYANGCMISPSRLSQLGIIFRQVPYDVKVG